MIPTGSLNQDHLYTGEKGEEDCARRGQERVLGACERSQYALKSPSSHGVKFRSGGSLLHTSVHWCTESTDNFAFSIESLIYELLVHHNTLQSKLCGISFFLHTSVTVLSLSVRLSGYGVGLPGQCRCEIDKDGPN